MNNFHKRTYGWVQNPSNLNTLKSVVQIFDATTSHYARLREDLVPRLIPLHEVRTALIAKLHADVTSFSYSELVGSSRNAKGQAATSRKSAVADGLIQVTIRPQSYSTTGKEWTDNWTADGYLRWALSLGLVKHDRTTDKCLITELGKGFARSSLLPETDAILIKAMLAYPPAVRILDLLAQEKDPVNKFYLGERLGFKGEKGFTSYPEQEMEKWLSEATTREEQRKIRSDIEGTADKYARMIAAWLGKFGFVSTNKQTVKTKIGYTSSFQLYSITAKGRHALQQSRGSSKNKRIAKYVNWEFLAIDGKSGLNASGKDYVRTRRAYILECLQTTKSFRTLKSTLESLGFKDSETVIRNDIQGLISIGFQININEDKVVLNDEITGLDIPPLTVTNTLEKTLHDQHKEELMERTSLPLKFYELYDIAFDPKRNRDFEIVATSLLREISEIDSKFLGGSLKPDGIAYQNRSTEAFGIIIDTKAYKDGYPKNKNQEDEMVRYIEDNQLRDPVRNPTEWWRNFPSEIKPENTIFLWISGKFLRTFEDQLVSTHRRTKSRGGAIAIDQLLIGVDKVIKGEISATNFVDALSQQRVARF